MTISVVLLIILVSGLAAAVVALAKRLSSRPHGRLYGLLPDHARWLLAQARGRADQPRYEIQVLDLGAEAPGPDQRWRASVWDADGTLRGFAYPDEGDTGDPEEVDQDSAGRAERATSDPDGQIGIEVPFTVCDAPTYRGAFLAADAWVSNRGAERVVLTVEQQNALWSETPGGPPPGLAQWSPTEAEVAQVAQDWAHLPDRGGAPSAPAPSTLPAAAGDPEWNRPGPQQIPQS
jgi:hypothetical protein